MFDTVPAAWVDEFDARQASAARHPSSQGGERERFGGGTSSTRPGASVVSHYVSSHSAGQIKLLVGPFRTAAEAEIWVDTAQDLLLNGGQLEFALAVQVTKMIGDSATARPGSFNELLKVRSTL